MARKHGVPAACHILRWAFLLASWSPVAWTQCTAPGCWPGKFYQFHVIGQAGQVTAAGAFTGFGDQPSLNDNGLVAFVGQIGSGNFEGVFTGNGSATPAWITTGFSSSGRTFGRAVQINNSSQIAARDSIPGSPPPSLVRIWNTASPGSWTLIAQGGSTGPFASVFAQPSTNTSAQVVFSALDQNGNTLLATPKGSGNPPFNEVRLSTPLRPMIDDNGNVVVRAGSTTTSPILLYPNNLGASLTIASTAEFDFIGQSPGISRDGKVVAFAGSLNPTGATHWNTNTGPGIFLALLQGGAVYQIIRVAGFSSSLAGGGLGFKDVEDMDAFPPPAGSNWDGYCDPGETCKPLAEIEDDVAQSGAATHIAFKTFDPNVFQTSSEWQERIGVIHTDFGFAGFDGDTIVVSFLATPTAASGLGWFSANAGLWTVRVDLRMLPSGPPAPALPLTPKVHRPLPVIQVGDKLGSPTETVTSLEVYDPIAHAATTDAGAIRTEVPGDHRLAFYAATNTSKKILRASHLDTDGDGLLDHWETYGIDFDGDGTLDLNLPALDPHQAPSPNHKDLFVEIDYMVGGNHTHQPDYNPNTSQLLALPNGQLPTQQVIAAFANAPVANPDNVTGITLHLLVDEGFPEVPIAVWGANVANSFDSLKEGTAAAGPCSAGSGAHLGTFLERADANCPNIIGARRLVERYAIFGHNYSYPSTPNATTGSSGVAKIRGNDFFVTLAAGANTPNPCANGVDWPDSASCLAQTWVNTATTLDAELADQQAGTLMHEFGHALGLFHGGDNLVANYKPNYLSIMNYSFQFNNATFFNTAAMPADCLAVPGQPANIGRCRTNRKLDYSRQALPAGTKFLDEANLSEAAGIGGPAGSRTAWYIPFAAGGASRAGGAADGPLDWNYSGAIDPATVSLDITHSGCGTSSSCPAPRTIPFPSLLTGHEDWSTLQYSFLDSPELGIGAHGSDMSSLFPEITAVEHMKDGLGTAVPVAIAVAFAGGGAGSVSLNPGTVNCSAACTAVYPAGTQVSFGASAAGGSFFSGWSGACSGVGPCNLNVVTGPVNLTAIFLNGTPVLVPNVAGLSQAAAAAAIASAGLVVGTVTTAASATVPSGSVISETPPAATPVAAGSSVNLTVSTGTPCDVNRDGAVDIADVQSLIDQALGGAPVLRDVNQDGLLNVIDVQIAINAVLKFGCVVN